MSKEKIILLVVSASIFVEALDIAIVNLAIPLIQIDFDLPGDVLHWIQTLYVLFYGGFLILGGKLADTLGRRNVFLAVSALFLITSAGAGLADSLVFLLLFRSVQGLAAALLMPSAVSIVTNTFREPNSRNQALGVFGSFAAIGSGSGLSIGGLIASNLGWQWIFFINVPVIAITILLAYKYIPRDYPKETKVPDVFTSLLFTCGILILTFIIHEMSAVTENGMQIGVGVLVMTLFLFLFYKRNRQLSSRLIDFSLYKNRLTLTANAGIVMMGAFFSSYLFLISIILQSMIGFSAASAGMILLPFSVMSAVVSRALIPTIMRRLPTIRVGIIGLSLFAMGGLSLLAALNFNYEMGLILLSIACVTGTGIAVCFSSLMVLAIQQLPPEQHGLASSIAQSSFFFGSGIGLSIIGFVLSTAASKAPMHAPVTAMSLFAIVGVIVLMATISRKQISTASAQ
jgi:MFS family permease